MFSGIIEAVGHVTNIENHGGDRRITMHASDLDLSDVSAGNSIAVNGACLTMVAVNDGHFSSDVSAETLSCTTLGSLRTGAAVNLEKALRLSDRLHGHLVTGHVDGVGSVRDRVSVTRSERLIVDCPAELLRYISRKGSVCVDGVSLTVNERQAGGFTVNIIPHTLRQTIMANYQAGTRVNIEVDIIARYLEQLFPHE
ncbi:MAG: riboflavin synthase [Gammaproteobacteria bacterium]